MIIATTYVSDLGIAIPYLKMDIAFIDERSRARRVNDLDQIANIIPDNVLEGLRKTNFSSCESSIVPRLVFLTLTNDRQLKLSYPFQPGSVEWQVFWNDLLANPQIISSKGIGETLTNSFLKRIQ